MCLNFKSNILNKNKGKFFFCTQKKGGKPMPVSIYSHFRFRSCLSFKNKREMS